MFKRVVSHAAAVENLNHPSHHSQTWQEKVLSTVYDDAANWLFFNPDNASICHCPQVECGMSSGDSLLHLILRWMKALVLKLVRSYCALPIVLVAIPLLVGVAIGFVLGRSYNNNYEPKEETKNTNSPRHDDSVIRNSCLSFFFSWISSWFLSVRWWWAPRNNVDDSFSNASTSEIHQTAATHSSSHVGVNVVDSSSKNIKVETTNGAATLDFFSTPRDLEEREERARRELQSSAEMSRESGVDLQDIPKHVAIIMDGNRRFGKAVYGNATSGHWEGSRKLLQVAKWCLAERIEMLTVYAFSTENWRRDPAEVAALMSIFAKYCEELRLEAIERNIRVHVLSSDSTRIPQHVKTGLERLQNDTATCKGGLEMNICLSYGSRGEIVNACRRLAHDCALGKLEARQITEVEVEQALTTCHCPDPDVLIRTSGEFRLSNFLLWQLAYTELFFVDRNWPEFDKRDLIDVIRSFAKGRRRRFGQ